MLLENTKISMTMLVTKMRAASNGSESAEQVPSRDGNVIELYCLGKGLELMKLVDGYNFEHGFDLDLFLVVGDMMDHQTIQIVCDVFPRQQAGTMTEAYASQITSLVPFRIVEEELAEPGAQQIVPPVQAFLTGEEGPRGLGAEQLARRVTTWHQTTKGIWSIRQAFMINYFLNRTLSSLAYSMGLMGDTIITPGISTELDGRVTEAQVTHGRIVQ